MFYNRYLELCRQKGVTPSRAAIDAGISKSLVSKWKSNQTREPSPQVIRKLADYFGISPYEVVAPRPSHSNFEEDPEVIALLEELRTRPQFRMLFKLKKGAALDDIKKAVRYIDALFAPQGETSINEVFAYRIPLPAAIKGVTIEDVLNGNHIIFINEHLCEKSRKQAYEHERNHCINNHFRDTICVLDAESEANLMQK